MTDGAARERALDRQHHQPAARRDLPGESRSKTAPARARTHGGRTIPLHPALPEALIDLKALRAEKAHAGARVIHSERGPGYSAAADQVWFVRLYKAFGFAGASSHSGRRTFITRAARKIVEAGGSLRDVQELAGHASLATSQRYIAGSTDAKRKVVALI